MYALQAIDADEWYYTCVCMLLFLLKVLVDFRMTSNIGVCSRNGKNRTLSFCRHYCRIGNLRKWPEFAQLDQFILLPVVIPSQIDVLPSQR